MRFYGNEICCCSYACMNALQDQDIDLQLFEISTSVPFGIRHMGDSNFDRLLTTYCDPNRGVDTALELWGYDVEKYEAGDVDVVIDYIRSRLRYGKIVLGPVDMGKLAYQVMPAVLKRMDHYITLSYKTEETVLCTDSEGFSALEMNYDDLSKCMDIKDLLEAHDKITTRMFKKRRDITEADICRASCEMAQTNLKNAETEHQGSYAITNCFIYLEGKEVYKWRLPLLYDFEYLMQRKRLFILLLQCCRKHGIGETEKINKYERLLYKQQKVLGDLYMCLDKTCEISKDKFCLLSSMEKELSEISMQDSC